MIDVTPPTTTRRRRAAGVRSQVLAAVAAMSLVIAACSDTTPEAQANRSNDSIPNADLSSDEIVLTSGLVTVDSCDALLERLKAEGAERVGPYGLNPNIGHFDDFIEEEAMDDDAMVESTADESLSAMADGDNAQRATSTSADAAESGGDSGGFSGTNNQELEVDEADMVKTDGQRLITVQDNQMQVIDVSSDNPSLVKTIQMPDDVWQGELFLDGDTVLVMSSGWTELPFMPVAEGQDASFLRHGGVPTGRLIQVDLERGEIERTLEFEGSYLSAREIDGTIRIVVTASANRFPFLQPSNPGAEDAALEFNRELIQESTIEQWIPTYRLIDGAPGRGLGGDAEVTDSGPLVNCDRVHLPQEFAGFGSVVVLTTNLDRGLELGDAVAVYTDASTVYASTDRLAVATPRWMEFGDDGMPIDEEGYTTNLHTFDITDTERAEYVASGSVVGYLLNQFSMSEHDGYLRVATTADNPWGNFERRGDERASESFVTVLAETDGALRPVGQVGGLGRGEQIFAVRFLGDRGYVVTFRQIDPLYTLDLSDPANPTVEGELKIPGFSNYLHPLGDGLLMGVGMDGDDQGRISGAVVSLFDVSDPSDPTQLDKLPLVDFATGFGESDEVFEADSYSPVNNDARAFNYFDDRAIVPVSWWRFIERADSEFGGQERNGSEAVLIEVEDRSLVEVARVAHPYLEQCEGPRGLTTRLVEVPAGDPDGGTSTEVPAAGEPDAEKPDAEEPDADQPADAEAGFVREGEPEQADVADEITEFGPGEEYCWIHSPEIFRTVVVGETLYTVAFNGVGVHDFDDGSFRGWIDFKTR